MPVFIALGFFWEGDSIDVDMEGFEYVVKTRDFFHLPSLNGGAKLIVVVPSTAATHQLLISETRCSRLRWRVHSTRNVVMAHDWLPDLEIKHSGWWTNRKRNKQENTLKNKTRSRQARREKKRRSIQSTQSIYLYPSYSNPHLLFRRQT